MKQILFLFLFLYFCPLGLCDGRLYIETTSTGTLESVHNNELITTDLIKKQTYNITNNLYSVVNKKDDLIVASNDVLIKLDDDSKLNLNIFEEGIENINELPTLAKTYTTNLTTTLSGTATFIVKSKFTEESPFIVSTPLVNILIKTGNIIIKSEEKNTMVIVLDGECIIYDTISKKTQIANKNTMTIIVPAPKLQGRSAEILKKQNIFSIKTLDEAEISQFQTLTTNLKNIQDKIKFIVFKGDVFGIKID